MNRTRRDSVRATAQAALPAASVAASLAERAGRVLPGGATHAARSYSPAIYVTRAEGSRKWLVDGRRLVDYTMGHGALLLGHAHPAVVAAVSEQVGRGTHFGAANPLEVEWAEWITALVPGAEQVRFTASGTEAAMLALRLARAFTGRDLVLKLDGHFHGWSDAVSVDLGSDGVPHGPPGVPAATAALTRVVRAGDVSGLRAALGDRRCAALVMEASGAHFGQVPLEPGFAAAARTLASETGTLLVVDEVVTGFRVAPGGMQQLLGISADLTLLGKVMAGGLPGGAVTGRSKVMSLLDLHEPPHGAGGTATRVVHPGTYNANPLSAAAGIATLRMCASGEPQAIASAYASDLERGWRDALATAGVAGSVWRLSSIVHCRLDDQAAQDLLANALRAEGIDLLHTSAFCSTAHDGDDLEVSVAAFAAAIRRASAVR